MPPLGDRPWPCPACGRERPDPEGCACGSTGAVQARRTGWLGGVWRLTADGGRATARLGGPEGLRAEGEGVIDRPLRVPPAATSWRAGQETLGVDQLDVHDPDWWTRAMVRQGRVVAAPDPSGARLALAWTVAVAGAVARGEARALVRWVRRWRRIGDQRHEDGAEAVEVRLARGEGCAAGGLEGVLAEVLDDTPTPLSALLASRPDADDAHAWLARRAGGPAADVDASLLAWFAEDPDGTAALVREALLGTGAGQGRLSRMSW